MATGSAFLSVGCFLKFLARAGLIPKPVFWHDVMKSKLPQARGSEPCRNFQKYSGASSKIVSSPSADWLGRSAAFDRNEKGLRFEGFALPVSRVSGDILWPTAVRGTQLCKSSCGTY